MHFDTDEFVEGIRDYFDAWYREILEDIFSPADTILGTIRLILSPILALLWIIGISFTFTLIGGVFILPFFTLHCLKLGR